LSHISRIELEITSLTDLKLACTALGYEFKANQTTYEWYGRFVGDAPLPEDINIEDLGRCDHAIKVPGCRYEIGVVKKGDTYHLLYDGWSYGGLEKAIGKDAGILKQAYTVERIKRDALKKGYRIAQQKNTAGIRLVLTK